MSSDPIDCDERLMAGAPDALGDLLLHIARRVPVRLSCFVFVMFFVLNTSEFIERVLPWWEGTVVARGTTNRGVVVQATIMTLLFAMFALLVDTGAC